MTAPPARSRWLRGLASAAAVVVSVRVALSCRVLTNAPDTKVSFTDGWEKALAENLSTNGYAHFKGLLNQSSAQSLRNLAEDYCYGETRKALPLSWGGYTVPAFLDLPEFQAARWLLEDKALHIVLRTVFQGDDYRFASHNDIGCDFISGWHKDILRGPVKRHQVHDVWSDELGQRHEIYKILFYLQDHENDDMAVKVVPGSHKLRHIGLEHGITALRPSMGDAIIFDQRLSHAGNSFYYPFGKGRIFMQIGFGKANIFTEEFQRGTVERQQSYQSKMLEGEPQRGLATLLADVKFTLLGVFISALPPALLNMLGDIDVKKHALLGHLIFGSNAK